jgi:cytochrome c oxidase subunit 3
VTAPSIKSTSTAAQTGVWVGIGAITMSFAAYSSALIVRQGASPDWLHFTLPPILFFNTLVVLASSVTLYMARTRIPEGAAPVREALVAPPNRTLIYITVVLGFAFLVGQILAWRNLAAQGLSLSSGPSSAFFYLLTAMHGLHLLGGLGGLLYVVYRIRRSSALHAVTAYKAASLYWHFMTVLWLYLFAILVNRI